MRDYTDLFPSALIAKVASSDAKMISLPISNDQFLVIPKETLTERERLLLAPFLTLTQEEPLAGNPWKAFLETGIGEPPQKVELIQFLHLKLEMLEGQPAIEKELLDLLTHLFPHLLTIVNLTTSEVVLVLNQEKAFDTMALVEELLPSLEFDFGAKMTALVGHIWPVSLIHQWPRAFQLEQRLFHIKPHNPLLTAVVPFSKCLLATASSDCQDLYKLLKVIIEEQEDMAETVEAMWAEQAVLTKAAQRLFIHRNTLQYRLDKAYQQTGLSLKSMDDLAVCYLSLLHT